MPDIVLYVGTYSWMLRDGTLLMKLKHEGRRDADVVRIETARTRALTALDNSLLDPDTQMSENPSFTQTETDFLAALGNVSDNAAG